jgi:hypothetical protein
LPSSSTEGGVQGVSRSGSFLAWMTILRVGIAAGAESKVTIGIYRFFDAVPT